MSGTNNAGYVVAYYMSKFEHDGLGLGNQNETFQIASEILGVKKNTIKNARDYFDPHTGSHRQGWHNVPLPPNFRKIHEMLKNVSELQLRNTIKKWIDGK
jgi:hypothetical protein